MQRLDEPLDMSLKSRKRSSPNEYLPKKKRASVIARETGMVPYTVPMEVLKVEPPSPPCTLNGQKEMEMVSYPVPTDVYKNEPPSPPPRPLNSRGAKNYSVPMEAPKVDPPSSSPPRTSDEPNSHILVIELSNNDVEEHFRRSLCRDLYHTAPTDVSTQGVDDHFRRSLGSAKWEEIKRQSLQPKSLQSTPPRTAKK